VERRLRRTSTARLLREARLVRESGTLVHVLVPGPEDLAAMGANLMAPQHRLTVLETSLRTTTAVLGETKAATAGPRRAKGQRRAGADRSADAPGRGTATPHP
jgi:NTE family protein